MAVDLPELLIGLAQFPALDEKGGDEAGLEGDHGEAAEDIVPVAPEDRWLFEIDNGAGRQSLRVQVPAVQGAPIDPILGRQRHDVDGVGTSVLEEAKRHLGRGQPLFLEL